MKGRGCLFWAFVVLLLVTVLVGGAAWFAFRGLKQEIVAFSSPESVAVPFDPEVRAGFQPTPPADLAAKREQLEKLFQGEAEEPVAVSVDELNSFLQQSEEAREYRDRVFLRSEGEDVVAMDLSLPLDEASELFGEQVAGRFLNATVRARLVPDGDDLEVDLIEVVSHEPAGKRGEAARQLRPTVVGIVERFVAQRLGELLEGSKVERIEYRDGELRLSPR